MMQRMSYLKQLIIDFYEFEDEILTVLQACREDAPSAFALLFDEDISKALTQEVFGKYTNDSNIVNLVSLAIDFDIIIFDNGTLKLRRI